MIFSEEPYLLHLLAGSESISSLDAVKNLLDSGAHNVHEREPADNLSALHVAAAWDRLAMCQLLVHYGADLNGVDIDKRRPVDVATGKSRRFLRKFEKHSSKDRNKFRKVLSFLFRRICVNTSAKDDSILKSMSFVHPSSSVLRQSCPILNSPSLNNQQPLSFNVSPARTEMEDCQPNIETRVEDVRGPSNAFSGSTSAVANEFLSLDNTLEVTQPPFAPRYSDDENCAESEPISKEEEELRLKFAELDINALKGLLREKNLQIGPMDAKSRRFYEGKLARFQISKQQPNECLPSINQYSLSLRKMVLNEENSISDGGTGLVEDRSIREEYATSVPKNEVSFFCYLLVDPSIISPATLSDVTFRKFISAIFYVGKGKRSRPLQHLIHASKCRSLVKNNPAQRSEKLRRIIDLWDRGEGVISLNLFTNIHSGEAFVREGSMIEAIGLDNLTNLQRGTFPGVASKWTRQQMAEFGALLLKKAHIIFKNERCRPIFEVDVAKMV